MSDVVGLYRRFGVKLKPLGDGWVTCRCFTGRHPDRHPSARVHLRSGGFRCFTCGARGGVLDALGELGVDRDTARALAVDYGILDPSTKPARAARPPRPPPTPLPPPSPPPPLPQSEPRVVDWDNPHGPTAVHDRAWVYQNEHGEPVGRVRRLDLADGTKRIWQERPDGDGWASGLAGKHLPLYQLPAVLEHARRGEQILIVEGEKAVDALHRIGMFATTNAGGAGKWWPEHSATLTGAHALVICDSDPPGRLHARQVSNELIAAGVEARMPYDPAPLRRDGYDIVDQLAEVAATLRAITPELQPDTLRERLHTHLGKQLNLQTLASSQEIERWHEHVSYLTNPDRRAYLECPRCGEQRVHHTSHGIAFCPCGHHQTAPQPTT